MKDNSQIRINNQVGSVGILCQIVLVELFCIFAIIHFFVVEFVIVLYGIVAMILFVMAYNNSKYFKRKGFTWIYLFFGVIILLIGLWSLLK